MKYRDGQYRNIKLIIVFLSFKNYSKYQDIQKINYDSETKCSHTYPSKKNVAKQWDMFKWLKPPK